MLQAILGSIAKDIVKSVGVSQLEDLTHGYFGLLKDKNAAAKDPEQLKKLQDISTQMASISNKLSEINTNIQSLATNINAGFFDLKKTMAQEKLDAIDSHYSMYFSALLKMDKDEEGKKAGSNRERVITLGTTTANTVFGEMVNINSFLTNASNSKTLLEMAWESTQTKLAGTKDLPSAYYLMKKFLLNYTQIQLKGIILMTCAWKDPDVPFSDAKDDIAAIYKNLDAQDAELARVIGPGSASLMADIFKSPDHSTLCTWISSHTKGHMFFQRFDNTEILRSQPDYSGWSIKLELQDDEKLDALDTTKLHRFKFTWLNWNFGLGWSWARVNNELKYVGGAIVSEKGGAFGLEMAKDDQVQIKCIQFNADIDGSHLAWRNQDSEGTNPTDWEGGDFFRYKTDDLGDDRALFKIASASMGIGTSIMKGGAEPLRPGVKMFSDNRKYHLDFASGNDGEPRGSLSLKEGDRIIFQFGNRFPKTAQFERVKLRNDGLLDFHKLGTSDIGMQTTVPSPHDYMIVTDDGNLQLRAENNTVIYSRGRSPRVGDEIGG